MLTCLYSMVDGISSHSQRYNLDPPLDQLVNFAACSQALAPKQIYGQYGFNTKPLVPEPNFHEPYGKRALAREQRLTYHSKQVRWLVRVGGGGFGCRGDVRVGLGLGHGSLHGCGCRCSLMSTHHHSK